MPEEADPSAVAQGLLVGVGLFVRQLRQAPVQGELTFPEIAALSRLERAGSSTTSELARAEQITPQAMGATLAGLERLGLVARRGDPADGRRAVMSVTAAGRRALRDKRSLRAEALAKVLRDGFTPAELQTLMAAVPLIERLGASL